MFGGLDGDEAQPMDDMGSEGDRVDPYMEDRDQDRYEDVGYELGLGEGESGDESGDESEDDDKGGDTDAEMTDGGGSE